jgi:hypothetical protein
MLAGKIEQPAGRHCIQAYRVDAAACHCGEIGIYPFRVSIFAAYLYAGRAEGAVRYTPQVKLFVIDIKELATTARAHVTRRWVGVGVDSGEYVKHVGGLSHMRDSLMAKCIGNNTVPEVMLRLPLMRPVQRGELAAGEPVPDPERHCTKDVR